MKREESSGREEGRRENRYTDSIFKFSILAKEPHWLVPTSHVLKKLRLNE